MSIGSGNPQKERTSPRRTRPRRSTSTRSRRSRASFGRLELISQVMAMLEHINGPEDLKELSQDQLGMLASEIRDVLVETVTKTSGHLGPNLGVVELTIAMHRVFDSPKDKLIFDTGHQSYVHKLL